jgi:hypothetical protein
MSDIQVPGEERQLPGQTDRGRIDIDAERLALLADALRDGNNFASRVRLRVYGESMLPAIWPGRVVEIAGCSLEDVNPGEIVLALRDGRLFLHRLLKFQADGFVLRGDSMPGPDPQYPPEALLGRLVRDTDTGMNIDQGRGVAAVAWNRALGMLLCHCSIVRRLALKFNRRGSAPKREFRIAEFS